MIDHQSNASFINIKRSIVTRETSPYPTINELPSYTHTQSLKQNSPHLWNPSWLL